MSGLCPPARRPSGPCDRSRVADAEPLGLRPWPSRPRALASERRAAARTAVVWEGRTPPPRAGRRHRRAGPASSTSAAAPAGSRSALAELGHRVTVVDPSPDALAALARRADEAGVADRVTGLQGDLGDLPDAAARRAPTWCSATACSRWSTTRPPRWPRSPRCCAPAAPSACWSASGTPPWSPARWPATSPRPGRSSTTRPDGRQADQARRASAAFTADEVAALLAAPGFTPSAVHGVRVFADLVPGSLLDLEPGASRGAARARAGRGRPARSTSPSPRQLHVARHALSADRSSPLGPVDPAMPPPDARRRTARPARRHGRVLRLGGDP